MIRRALLALCILGAACSPKPPEPPRQPVEVEVAQAFLNEDKLNVKVLVTPRTKLPASDVVVTLRGLKEGKLIEEQSRKMSDELMGDTLSRPTVVRFVLDAGDISEYQVACSWGDDAKRVLGEEEAPQPVPSVSANTLVLTDAAFEKVPNECATPPCDDFYVVTGSLRNGTDRMAHEIVLAFGLFWTEEGTSPTYPPEEAPLTGQEEKLPLKGIELAPGTSKKVRLRLDKGVPAVEGGAFLPHIRLLDYSLR